jgi:aarF domain-containing kinase
MGSGKSRVPAGRVERLFRMGTMAADVAAGTAVETARTWWSGEAKSFGDLVASGINPRRLTRDLARMRGAAMKLGQLLSLEGDDFLPAPLAEALAGLQDDGDTMSDKQLELVLASEFGKDWRSLFQEFDTKPMAAASIGQVHRAVARDGRRLAMKVQFPGVARSIDSDVDNLGSLIQTARLVPAGFELAPLLEEVKRQLRQETDYLQERQFLDAYRGKISDMKDVQVPGSHADLTTKRILAMDLIDAPPLSRVWEEDTDQETRDYLGRLAQTIVFRELFQFGLMQTDPNYANYLWDPKKQQMVLLDFGSTIDISDELRCRYQNLVTAAVNDDMEQVIELLVEYQWAPADSPRPQLEGVAGFLHLSVEPLRKPGNYDYGSSDLQRRARERAIELAATLGGLAPPPPEIVFIQRKLGGTFLLCSQLGARIDSFAMFQEFLAGNFSLEKPHERK